MPSRILGRASCPECGFESAHVKQSDKGTLYRYCPSCGAQYFPRGEAATERLRTAMRPEGTQALPTEPVSLPPEPVAPPTGTDTTTPQDDAPPPTPTARERRRFALFKD